MISLRPLTIADLDLACRHRERMFTESGRPPEAIAAMVPAFREWLEFARRGLTYAVLHATEAGRPLYEQLGWEPTAEMARRLPC